MKSQKQEKLFSENDEAFVKETTFRLERLEVCNWGPFRGLHRADFDSRGTAIIGPTGSGKTTLIDALMTLLVDQPRYNLASTGGHESDRTLFSYVRGVLGGDGADGRQEVARPAKTTTGICATFGDGNESLCLAGLLWTEGTGNAADDFKRRWIFSQADGQSLEHWLRLLHDESVRELMRLGRETAKLRIFDSKKAYLERVRKFFDVGENAFTLLNRAAGLKQLNSIDEIFRELVLDDHAAFDRALEVAGEFGTLQAIHAELETARQQQESLLPIAEEHQAYAKAQSKVARFQTLKHVAPIWFAIVGRQKWSEELQRLDQERAAKESERQTDVDKEGSCRIRVDALRERYLKLGGNAIGDLEKTIEAQTKLVDERRRLAADYRRSVVAFGLTDELTAAALKTNQNNLRQSQVELRRQEQERWKTAANAQSQFDQHERACAELIAALQKVEDRPRSNIPLPFQDFRLELAAELQRSEDDLPFLAELVEVKADESAWRGAIERAMGSERLRVLVPEDVLDRALRWVNHRNNKLHVRLRRARRDESSTTFFPDGYSRKVNFKNHPLRSAAERLLAERDLHCVPTPEVLRDTEYGLTIEGMISGRRGSYEKQDQRRLDHDWMTGFDNKDQLRALAGQLKSARDSAIQWQGASKAEQTALTGLRQKLQMIEELLRIEFSSVDLPSAESDLAMSRERLELLLDPNSNAGLAKQQFNAEVELLKSIQKMINDLNIVIGKLTSERSTAEKECKKAQGRIGAGLTEDEMTLASQELTILSEAAADDLDELERSAEDRIDRKLTEQTNRLDEIQLRLVRFMGIAKHTDTGALANVGTEIEDVPNYLDRLRVLNEEALPEKRRRFLEYLNRSSDQGVTQLLAGIEEEVDAIEQRIGELNLTLVKVDFREGRYLQLQPQRIKHERLRALETAMRKVRGAALKDDEGESHYAALRELVEILRDAGENPRQVGARALLDPRHRLQFFVVEVDRATGNQSAPRTGSQSGSGGEKELMASHILTASLSYALCPVGTTRPLYGTVILDEAFSKSSPSAAGRIIEALRVFHLHPIFVTPNKEIGLLKRHTHKVICVQRALKEAGLASISWERLEELANSR